MDLQIPRRAPGVSKSWITSPYPAEAASPSGTFSRYLPFGGRKAIQDSPVVPVAASRSPQFRGKNDILILSTEAK